MATDTPIYEERPPDCRGAGCGDCFACAVEAERRYRHGMAMMNARYYDTLTAWSGDSEPQENESKG